jgi:hypothetical protein
MVMTQNPDNALLSRYSPLAIYYEDADYVEYVRQDVAAVHRRVDDRLTLVLDMATREPIGFNLKGFKHFCNSQSEASDKKSFLDMVSVLERLVSELGDRIFSEDSRRVAYRKAIEIAKDDRVELHNLPQYAHS